MFSSGFALFLAATAFASASPVVVQNTPVTLPFAKRMNLTGSASFLHKDRVRARLLRDSAVSLSSRDSSVYNLPSTDQGAVEYVVNVTVGNPPTSYSLLVDTGSSNTWVGGRAHYVKTNSSVTTGMSVEVTYGSGLFFGQEYLDDFSLAGLTIHNQSLGSATLAFGFGGTIDGILGLGPTNLTCGTLSNKSACVPTVTETAYSQGLIQSNEIGVSFGPSSELNSLDGELIIGGNDPSKYTGDIDYVPLTTTYPASRYVGINQTITYGDSVTILEPSAGITDTGTTLLLLATDALQRYQNATGAISDASTGLLSITPDQYSNLKSLFFNINGIDYEFTPNAQIWPRALNSAIGGTSDKVYLIAGDLGTESGTGFDFVNGKVFLERFYTTYDIAGGRFGIAKTAYTYAITN